ncbi:methyltransferase domain-containing protein, partial [Nanoarchaeota archaeon]
THCFLGRELSTIFSLTKNFLSKVDLSKIDFKAIIEGRPLNLPHFKVLDIGCGFGKWGYLIRDNFDVMFYQNFKKEDWKIDITGVEPFTKCLTPIQRETYNRIYEKDIFDIIDDLDKYDFIIMGDVIEHFEKDKAHQLLKKLFNHSDNILISTPNGFLPQNAWGGNKREIHKSGWKLEDFKDYTVVEHRVIKDEMFHDILKNITHLPESITPDIELLVLWLKK